MATFFGSCFNLPPLASPVVGYACACEEGGNNVFPLEGPREGAYLVADRRQCNMAKKKG